MKLGLKLLSFLLVFILTAGNLSQVAVYADEKTGSEQNVSERGTSEKELTSLEITDLSEPVAGKELDTKASIRSAEGVTWEIPVIWIGEDGKAATVAEPGKKYIPNFAFYVPNGYRINGNGAGRSIRIKLPKFLEAFGMDHLLFVADPSNGITYITWDVTNLLGASAVSPVYDTAVSESKEADMPESNGSGDAGDVDTGNNDTDESPFWEVNVHCTQNLIANVGYETLAELVRLIKNEIEPRAVSAIMEGFPAYAEASYADEIGTSIGLYVYDSRFDSYSEDYRNFGDGVDAYVWAADLDSGFSYFMGVNCANILTVNASGIYELSENGLTQTKNILTHELMHAFMDDYTRTGLNSLDSADGDPDTPDEDPKRWNSFPKWFSEGTASTVHNAYQYHQYSFYLMTADYVREEGDSLFTCQSVGRALGDTDTRVGSSIKTYRTDYAGDVSGAYAGGYLAVVYLSALVANGGIDPGIPDNDTVRNGLSCILEQLHTGTPLDTIISNTGKYDGLIDFENRFGSDEDDSLRFCVDFLNHLDEITPGRDVLYTNNPSLFANGSILMPFDTQKGDPTVGRTETSNGQSVLRVADTADFVPSTVDDGTAKESAGSYHVWDDETNMLHEDEEAAAAAVCALPEETVSQRESDIETELTETVPESENDITTSDDSDPHCPDVPDSENPADADDSCTEDGSEE